MLEREADELRRKTWRRRTWSRDPTIEVHGWSKLYFEEIAPSVRANHRRCHRDKRRQECGPLCEARDHLAGLLSGFAQAPKSTALPLLGIITSPLSRFCDVCIPYPESFYRGVRRDLVRLRKMLAVSDGDRCYAERALIRRYHETAGLIKGAPVARSCHRLEACLSRINPFAHKGSVIFVPPAFCQMIARLSVLRLRA